MRNFVNTFICLIILVFIGIPVIAQEKTYDALLNELFPSDEPGGTAIIVKDGKTVYLKAFGKANLELDVDMQTDNIFRIGSITKQFTACAILKLMEEGKISLQDDITKYIEDYPTHGHKITIEHLLTHTSGIKSMTSLKKWDKEARKKDFTPEEMIDWFKNEPMDFATGEEFRYNNSAYFILGYIIEIVSGKTYTDYLEDTFFEPLGMDNTSYGNTSNIVLNRAAGYQKNKDNFKNADFLSMTQPYGAGSLLSTVENLSIWYHAVNDGKVVRKESLKKAHTSFILNNGKETSYGFGWFLGNIQGVPMYQHGGGINGYLTASLFLPDENLFVAVFSNCGCHAPGRTAFKLAAEAIGNPYKWEQIDLDNHVLETYVGVYKSEYNGKRIISYKNDSLYSMVKGGSKTHILPFEKDKFFMNGSLATLIFQPNNSGEIGSVISKSPYGKIVWKKTSDEVPVKNYVELDKSVLESYVGKYELMPEFILSVFIEGDKVYTQATGQNKVEIKPISKNEFQLVDVDAKLIFNSDENNEVTSLTLIQNGKHKAKKIE